jgi:tRNA pseudouridine13 synthase
MLGHYKGSLQLILATPFKEDSQQDKQFKYFCREHWGQWADCLQHAPPAYRRMVRALAQNGRDLKGAIKTISREMLNLHLLAYQSFIFNQVLKKYVAQHGINTITVPYSVGSFVFYRKLTDVVAMRRCTIPMVNEKVSLCGETGSMIQSILKEEGITPRDFSLRTMRFRGVRFKPFSRSAIIFPQRFRYGTPVSDELYVKKRKMRISFTLPPGSYATLLIRRLAL